MYGLCDFEVIDDDIAQWHESTECTCELHEYLGLTEEEYSLFVRNSDELENRVAVAKAGATVSDIPVGC